MEKDILGHMQDLITVQAQGMKEEVGRFQGRLENFAGHLLESTVDEKCLRTRLAKIETHQKKLHVRVAQLEEKLEVVKKALAKVQ